MSNQQGGSGGKSTENMLLAVVAIVIGISLVFWLAGHVAAFLYGAASPHASLANMTSVMLKLAQDPLHPALAWPSEDRNSIPGPFLFYLAMFGVIAAIAGVALGIHRIWKGGGSSKTGFGTKETQWAKRGDLKSLVVRGPEKGRLVLGSVSGSLVATEQRHSVIVLGPTQSGKTTGLAVPSILEWQGPVIATSVKNDLAQDTMAWRLRQGDVYVYDPTKSTGLPASTWSPLDGARDWAGAKKIASWLKDATKSSSKNMSDGDFWYNAAGKLLAPYLFAAAANGYTMGDIVRWIDIQEEWEVRSLLQAAGVDEAMTAADASWNRDERTKSSIFTTAEIAIDAYSDPTVLESARTSEIQPRKFFDGGNHTLYICAPTHEQDRLRPVFTTIIKQFINAAYDFGKRLDPPLLIVLDEAANIAPLDNLDAIASTCSGLGIQLVTVWQDLSQINSRYGDRANTVVNNHRAKIVLSGISDPSTLDYVSRLVGSESVSSESTTVDGQGSRSTTKSNQDKNLAPSDVVRRIKINEGLLVYGALLPARLRLRPWYRSKRLKAMVENKFPDAVTDNADGEQRPPPPPEDYMETGNYDTPRDFADYQKSSPV